MSILLERGLHPLKQLTYGLAELDLQLHGSMYQQTHFINNNKKNNNNKLRLYTQLWSYYLEGDGQTVHQSSGDADAMIVQGALTGYQGN